MSAVDGAHPTFTQQCIESVPIVEDDADEPLRKTRGHGL
jgi:hypothetical protein